MKRIFARSLAVALALTLFVGPAAEAVQVYRTFLTLSANKKKVKQGQKVKFHGRLTSPFAKCMRWRPVELWAGNKKKLTKKTSRTGHFTFVVRPKRTKKWYARFKGRQGGKHPSQFICRPSRSRSYKIRVIRA